MSEIDLTASLTITDRAQSVLRSLEDDRDEPVAIVLNDGCCDGMGPVALDASMVGANDVRIGSDGGIGVYAPRTKASLREGYNVIIDVTEATGVGSFSLEVPLGYRFTADEFKDERGKEA